MTTPSVLDALVQAAVDATGAACGWIVIPDGQALLVSAAAGDRPGDALGLQIPGDDGSAVFVVQSGQPLALTARPGDPRIMAGVAAALGRAPTSVLCVPCMADDVVVGALEVVDSAAGAFTVDDVEVVTLLGTIAGAALADTDSVAPQVADAAELGRELTQLAAADPARYAFVASVLQELLSHG